MTKYYATASGAYLGAYDGIDPPAGAVEVPTHPMAASQVWDGSTWGDPPPILDDLRVSAKSAVDVAAEAYRLTFITGGAGQAMAYTQKLAEAQAYLADTSLTVAECPHVFAEVGLTGQTAWEVAQIVVNLHAIWQIKSAEIERKRLAAKAAIDTAETAEAISNAADVDWGA